jgi:O-antigen/teichoic acid export membrane protein
MGLRRKATQALSWQVLARGADRGLRFLSSLLLARLLAPDDFGRLAGALFVASVVEAISFLGVEQAIIRSSRGADPRFLGTAFRVMAVRGVVVAAVVAACAPLSAWYFEDASLAGLSLIVALSPLVLGFANPWIASLRRELDFRAYSIAMTIGGVAQVGCAIALASLGLGAKALVIAIVANSATTVVAGWLLARRKLDFTADPEALSEIRGIAGKAAGMPFLLMLAMELPSAILGRVADLSTLGTYTLARRLCSLPTEVALPIFSSVLTPAYASIRDDPARLRRVWLVAVSGVALLTAPVVAGSVVLDDALPRLCYGSEYAGAPGVVSILGISAFVNAITACCGALFWGLGAPQRDRTQVGIRLATAVPLAIPAAYWRGALGVAAAVAISQLAGLVYSIVHARRLVDCDWRELVAAMRAPAIVTVASLSATLLANAAAVRFGCGDLGRTVAASIVVLLGMAAAGWWIVRRPRAVG